MTNRVAPAADINVTPLIDVMLVLLIIFMVVTPLSHRALDTALPHEGPRPPAGDAPALIIAIGPEGYGLAGELPGTASTLETRLRDALALRHDKTVFVRASAAVSYGDVIAGLDAARGAGAERIGMLGRDDESR